MSRDKQRRAEREKRLRPTPPKRKRRACARTRGARSAGGVVSNDWDEDEDVGQDALQPVPRRRRRYRDEEEEDEPRRGRGSWSCLLLGCVGGVLIVVLLVIAGAFVVAGNGSLPVSLPVPGGSSGTGGNAAVHMQQSQQAVQLSSIAQMQVQNQVGDISISVDPSVTTPTVTTVKKVQASSDADAQKEFGRISVEVQGDSSTNTLTVSVTLPATSGTILSKNADAVDVAIALPPGVVSTGVLTHARTQLTLDATTSAGNVVINGLNGVLVVKDSFGNVTVHQATLADGSHLETGTGDVVFDGALDVTGTANAQPMFKMQAEKGNVEVSLPATTNVILDANVNVGSIRSEFPITVTTSAGSPSYYGPLTNGATPPTAVLVLDVSSGDIDLHRM